MALSRVLPVLSIALVTLVANWPSLLQGFPLGHDWSFELVRISEYRTALADGQWPPYWASNLYHGHGSPVFLYYGSLYCLVASWVSLVTTFLADAANWTTVIFSGIGAWGIYLLAGSLLPEGPTSRACARMASYFYLLYPYLIGDRLIRNANAEHAALSLAPLVFFGLIHLGKFPIRGTSILAVALGLVIFAHNLTSLTIFAATCLLAPILYPPGVRSARLAHAAAGILLALLLSSFFWFPVWSMMPLVANEDATIGKFDFHNNFQYFTSYFGFKTFFSGGILTPIFMLLGCAILLLDRKFPRTLRPALSVLMLLAAGLVFLLSPYSAFVWENLPFLRFFQFPWRFMGPLAIVMAIILAIFFYRWLMERPLKDSLIWELALLAIVFLQALPVMSMYKSVHSVYGQVELEEMLHKENIKAKGLGVVVLPDHFFPLTVKAAGITSETYPLPKEPVIPDGKMLYRRDVRGGWELGVQTPRAMSFPLNLWAFPVFSASVNGKEVPLELNRSGTWSIPLAPGVSEIRVLLQPPEARVRAFWITLLFVGLGLLCRVGLCKRIGLGKPEHVTPPLE